MSHYNLDLKNHPTFMTYFDDTYFEDHLYLLELSTFFEPKIQYSFDDTFQSIDDEIAKYEQWEEFFDGPKPIHETIVTP